MLPLLWGTIERRLKEVNSMGDLISRRFGKLVVIERSGTHTSPCGTKRALYLCKCDCGNEVVVQSINLTSGNTTSCGCHRSKTSSESHTKHGCAKKDKTERLYNVWKSMISRCYYKRNSRYDRYGGRGIQVCDEWKNSYESFRKWSLENGYDKEADFGKCTIDRIDNDGNYEPANCRWVDMKVQARNRKCADMRGGKNE